MSILRKFSKKSAGSNTDSQDVQEKSLKNKALGDRGEEIACVYLVERGFKVIERNFSGVGGEVDIIAEKDGEIHFIEVKTRTSRAMGDPLESITPKKQRRIRKAAELWLLKSKYSIKGNDVPHCIFSAIGIDMVDDYPEIEFLEDAFM